MINKLLIFMGLCIFFIFTIGENSITSDEVRTVGTSSEINVSVKISNNYADLSNLENLNLKFYLNNKTGTPHRIFGRETKIEGLKETCLKQIKEEKIKEENILKITDNFISAHEKFLKVNPADLKLEKFDSDGENYYMTYQQYYDGIPVYRGVVGLTIDKYGRILVMGSDFQQGISISTIPEISKGDAIRIAKEDINFNDNEYKIKEISLMIIQKEDAGYTLAWNVFVLTESPLGDWIFFIDAFSGKIIKKHNNIKFGSVNGTVSGMIYPKRYDDVRQEKNFSYEIIKINMTSDSSAFYSGTGTEGNFYDANMTTLFPINLSNATHANLTFLIQYDIEPGWDFVYVEISNDSGNSWKQLKSRYMSSYAHPQVYARGWINNSVAYTGNSYVMLEENINISNYTGGEILLRFRYTCDKYEFKEGFYVDNISVITDSGVVFFDDAENSNGKWNLSKFKVVNKSFSTMYAITDKNGYYEISGIENNTNIHSELIGLYVDVDNDKQHESAYNFLWNGNGTYNWNWFHHDTSYGQQEQNVYYHVNKIHDYFSGFNFSELDYPLKAVVEANGVGCNAYYSSGRDRIAFSGPRQNCESPALGSDIIYHEYAHAVVDHIYDLGESGDIMEDAMHEAFADYFACTINNDSIVADGWSFARNLNNTRKYPENWNKFNPHISGLILGGALWDVRKKLNKTIADSLIFKAIRITPHAYNFSEFLDNLLIADDNNSNIEDGTPHRKVICNMFSRHGIYSAAGLCENELINCDGDDDGFDATGETSEGICDGYDCNDSDANINPNAMDIPNNGIDENCNGYDNRTYYGDFDNDGYGNATNNVTQDTPPAGWPTGWITNAGKAVDCDDNNAIINPDTVWFYDADNDTYGNATNYIISCDKPSENYVLYDLGLDCDDNNDSITDECCTKFDFDNNTAIDIFDVVAALEYLSEGKQIYNTICSEANGNGRIDLIDMFALIDKIVTGV